MALPITITDAGRAEIINAQNTGTGPVTITEIGFGTGQYTPTKTRTALQAEVKRVSSIAGQAVAADTIHVMALDESSAAYNVGEFGLFSDKGTLIAVYSQPAASGWIIQKAGPSTLLLATDIILQSLDASSITFGDISFINPPATTTIQGVVELATPEETQAGLDGARAVTPAGLKSLTGTTSRAGLVQLDNTLTSTSTSRALTAAQGKKLQEEKQPLDGTLTALAALVTAANKLIYATGFDTFSTTELTAFARTLLDDVDAATARSTLGIVKQTSPTDITSGSVLTVGAFGLGYAIALAGGTDLNALSQPGTYAYLSGPHLVNAPTTGASYIEVAGRAEYPVQIFHLIYQNRRFIRASKVSNPTIAAADWNDWAELFHTGNVSSFAQTLLNDADAAEARSTLGAQASDATLTALAGITTAANKLIYATGFDTFATSELTAFARTLLDDVDAATARSTLGIVKQTSPTDTTSGSVMTVGAFGLGYAIALAGGTDLNALSQPGTYAYLSGPDLVNAPTTGAGYIEVAGRAAYPVQIFHLVYQNRRFIRASKVSNPTIAAADWHDWAELFHTGNVSPFAQSLLDDTSAAAARSTLGITVADGGLGYGQTWQDVSASRALNTTYTNTTGKPIQVSVVAQDQGSYYTSVYVSGVLIGRWDMSTLLEYCQTFIVPPGATYMVSGNNGSAGGNTLSYWLELR